MSVGPSPETSRQARRRQRAAALAQAAGWTAAGFSAATGLLLAATVLQLRATDPLNLPSLARLRDAALRHPDVPQLAEDVRALDLLARRAFFTSLHQIRVGSRVLVSGILVALLAFCLRKHLEPPSPCPRKASPSGDFETQRRPERRAVLAVAGVLALTALTLRWWFPTAALRGSDSIQRTAPVSTGRATNGASGVPAVAVRPDRVWPAFRGLDGTGVAVVTNVPIRWNGTRHEGIRWKAGIPRPGVSSPIVWEEDIWLTAADESGREVYAYRLSDGALQWRAPVTDVPGSPDRLPEVSEETGWAAPTPVTDGVRIYALFGNGDLVALNRSGRTVWARTLGVPRNPYGHASSLRMLGDLLFVQYDQSEGGCLLAIESATGREVWRRDRPTISWASPICVPIAGRMELILADSRAVRSYDPRTGTELWAVECLSGEVAPSPASRDGWIVVANEYAIACALRVGAQGAEKVWEYDDVLPAVASPLHTGSRVFLASADGRMACLDAQKGTERWHHEFTSGFYASPLAAAGFVYALDREGTLHVLRDADHCEIVAASPLGEPAVATPAIVDGVLVIRGRQNLYGIHGISPEAPTGP